MPSLSSADAALAVSCVRYEHAALRFQLAQIKARLRRKYRSDQPRIPAGSPGGGQWTSDGPGTGPQQVLSDATPDNLWRPGVDYAQNTSRGPRGSVFVNGQWLQPTPAQAARLAVAESRANAAIERVREIEPNWRPSASAYETIEGRITSAESEAREAEARWAELGRKGIVPGPYADESISARSPERNFTTAERAEINRIGSETGCHTCGTLDPATSRGNFVLDHQFPTALNFEGRAQRLFPQCQSCSLCQGGYVRGLKYRAPDRYESKALAVPIRSSKWLSMNTIRIAPANSLIFVHDPAHWEGPDVTGKGSAWWTDVCVALGVLCFVDGETEIVLGRSDNVNPGAQPIFDRMIKTPNKRVIVSTIEGETGLRQDTGADLTRVRIWANMVPEPDHVIIGID